jgi:hypothetical protein
MNMPWLLKGGIVGMEHHCGYVAYVAGRYDTSANYAR